MILPELLDHDPPTSVALYLEIPLSKVVLFQGFFENYEGLAVVRTLGTHSSIVVVRTTPSMFDDCVRALEGLADSIPWRQVAKPAEI